VDSELEDDCIRYWDDCVEDLKRGKDPIAAMYNEIVAPSQTEFLDDGQPPSKSKLADRAGHSQSRFTGREDLGSGNRFDGTTSVWDAFAQTGLIYVTSSPWGDRVNRNEILRQYKHNDVLRRDGVPRPAQVTDDHEAKLTRERRRLLSRYGLNLVNRYDPDRLKDVPAESYPSAYIDASAIEVLVGAKAELEFSAPIRHIDIDFRYVKDEHRSSERNNAWEFQFDISFTIDGISPVRDMNQIEYYLRRENNRFLKSVIQDDNLQGCTCETVNEHILHAYSQLPFGATDDDSAHDDEEGRMCTLSPEQIEQMNTDWSAGKVTLQTAWTGIKASNP